MNKHYCKQEAKQQQEREHSHIKKLEFCVQTHSSSQTRAKLDQVDTFFISSVFLSGKI
jgi:hypothetical protein